MGVGNVGNDGRGTFIGEKNAVLAEGRIFERMRLEPIHFLLFCLCFRPTSCSIVQDSPLDETSLPDVDKTES